VNRKDVSLLLTPHEILKLAKFHLKREKERSFLQILLNYCLEGAKKEARTSLLEEFTSKVNSAIQENKELVTESITSHKQHEIERRLLEVIVWRVICYELLKEELKLKTEDAEIFKNFKKLSVLFKVSESIMSNKFEKEDLTKFFEISSKLLSERLESPNGIEVSQLLLVAYYSLKLTRWSETFSDIPNQTAELFFLHHLAIKKVCESLDKYNVFSDSLGLPKVIQVFIALPAVFLLLVIFSFLRRITILIPSELDIGIIKFSLPNVYVNAVEFILLLAVGSVLLAHYKTLNSIKKIFRKSINSNKCDEPDGRYQL